jgi:hypothetical protein
MNLNTNIQSVMIQFLKVKELKQIQTINKNFHNDLIKNKKTIQNMIKYETFLFQRSFLYDAISERIVNILLIKYDTIETIYNKYKNIDYHQYYSSPHYTLILKDIFDLMIDNRFNPYKNYANNFVYIDMIYIRILRSFYGGSNFITFINEYLNASKDNEKINKFIYLTSKRMTYNYNATFVFNNDTFLYELSPP